MDYSWITLFPLDTALVRKIAKRHFFGDILNSCHWVTDMGLEPHQKNFFENISKSIAARPLQSFDTNKGMADISVVL